MQFHILFTFFRPFLRSIQYFNWYFLNLNIEHDILLIFNFLHIISGRHRRQCSFFLTLISTMQFYYCFYFFRAFLPDIGDNFLLPSPKLSDSREALHHLNFLKIFLFDRGTKMEVFFIPSES